MMPDGTYKSDQTPRAFFCAMLQEAFGCRLEEADELWVKLESFVMKEAVKCDPEVHYPGIIFDGEGGSIAVGTPNDDDEDPDFYSGNFDDDEGDDEE
jgi:hypothetical protein